jgi:uncharacterized protein (DUF2062 family)
MKLTWDVRALLKNGLQHLREIRDAPHAVAGGVAVGFFYGFTPLLGVKTLLSIATAWIFRYSRLSAAIAVSLHDLTLPVWPMVLRWEYQLGYWVLNHPHQFPPALHVGELHLQDLFTWHASQVLLRTVVGSLIIGVPIAIVTYWVVLRLLGRYERTHDRHLQPPP